jgi:predicted nucleic acid-binding protein
VVAIDTNVLVRLLVGDHPAQSQASQRIARVIAWHEAGLDFADALHLALSAGQGAFVSFDAKFRARAAKHTDQRVEKPA